jgi:hypothetical protein
MIGALIGYSLSIVFIIVRDKIKERFKKHVEKEIIEAYKAKGLDYGRLFNKVPILPPLIEDELLRTSDYVK